MPANQLPCIIPDMESLLKSLGDGLKEAWPISIDWLWPSEVVDFIMLGIQCNHMLGKPLPCILPDIESLLKSLGEGLEVVWPLSRDPPTGRGLLPYP